MRRDDRRDDRRDRDRSRDRRGRDDGRGWDRGADYHRRDDRDDRRHHDRDRSRSRSRSPGRYGRDHRDGRDGRHDPGRHDERRHEPPSAPAAEPAPAKRAEVRLVPPTRRLRARVAIPKSSARRSHSRRRVRSRTPTPTRTLFPLHRSPAPTPNEQPLSLEELLRKRKAEAEASARPSFVSKKDREAAALKRREEEVAARRDKGAGAGSAARGPFPFRDTRAEPTRGSAHDRRHDHDRKPDRDDAYAARARERELELIRAQYMGGAKPAKKVTKPSDKFKFKFDWDKDQDTSVDLNPLYERPHESALAFGRGARAGVDRRVVAEEGAKRQMALVSQSRRDLGIGRVTDEEASRLRRGSRVASEREAREAADAKQSHWSEKSAEEMTERDWRIFREDHNITTRGGRLPTPMRSWSEAAMPSEIVRAIQKVGYDKPSPIQMASIPIGLLKRDVIGIAETGSGKTCAFVVPMLAYIMELPRMTDEVATRGPYALVMAPTRELAQQIEEETVKFAHFLDYRVASVVGGQDIEQQGFKLRKGCEIVIGTPGRVIDVLERRYTVFQQCNYIVLDEADRMIDMGFEPQVNAVMESMSADSLKPLEEAESLDAAAADGAADLGTKYRMTYMFSATMPPSVERLARKYLRNPAVVTIGSAGKSSDLIKQVVRWTTKQQKPRDLELTLSQFPDTQAIVFVNAKRSVDAVCASVAKLGYSVASLHGGKSQDAREEALRGFKAGECDVLVATDVAGRGIDVKNIDLVVNYELPFSIENYTHRIGRTGRAGRAGTAVAFLTAEDTDIMYDLKALLKSSNNAVPPELERHEASRVKPMRDGKGGWGAKMTREQMQGMQEIIH